MNSTSPRARGASALLPIYKRPPMTFVRGEGVHLFDDRGARYLDFGSGIAVNALGHGHPVLRDALMRQADRLWHASNLFHTEPAEALALALSEASGFPRVFLCNSGTEANEAALKFAALRHRTRREDALTAGADPGTLPARDRVVAFTRSFHGRTCGALGATANEAYRAPFTPLLGKETVFAPFDRVEGLDEVVTARTLAVLVEPVQGEGGVYPASEAFLARLRALCDATDTPLLFDEIQCGLGRTGRFLAHESYLTEGGAPLRPDMVTLAKPLAGGLPCGAVLLTEEAASHVRPGDHGTTFGGNPLACAVAAEVVRLVSDPSFLARVEETGGMLAASLARLAAAFPTLVTAVRGRGLMWGVDLSVDAAGVVDAARDAGLVILTAGARTLRLLPPLVVGSAEVEGFERILGRVLDRRRAAAKEGET